MVDVPAVVFGLSLIASALHLMLDEFAGVTKGRAMRPGLWSDLDELASSEDY